MLAFRLSIYASIFILGLTILQLLFLRLLNSAWWRHRWVKLASLGYLLFTMVGAAIWIIASYRRNTSVALVGAYMSSAAAVISLGLCGSLLISGLINTPYQIYLRWRRKRAPSANPQSQQRRVLLQRATAIIPAAALGISATGMARSFSATNVHSVPMHFVDLPADLEGFRILQISDSHLGPYIDLDDIEAMLVKVEKFQPHLVLISGDIADYINLLADAIKMFESIKAPYGAYACMGNHDYYRGAGNVMARFEASSIPMLINAGVTIKVGATDVFIGGADDPRYLGRPIDQFMRETVDRTLEAATSDSFKILMSHRPTGFDRSSEHGVELTLMGHTHGGQIGVMGKPVLARWGNEKYIRGKYMNGKSLAYTSSGVGHWFPFRLGCPTEAPVFVLKKGEADPSHYSRA
jgi:predicted MPP superfamily phosphohydrolase